MRRRILLNMLLNLVIAVVFIAANQWALQNQFEETFVALAIFYGLTVIVGNSLYISLLKAA